MKRSFYLNIVLFLSVFTCQLFSQQNNVTFLNTGKMYVAPGGYNNVALFIPDAMRVLGDQVKISHDGTTELGGSFFHDASTNVFELNAATSAYPDPTTSSTGIFRFVTTRGSANNRFITTQQNAISTFDRNSYYAAFPAIEIATDDSIVVPGKMGIDARSVRRNGGTGSMILRSEVVGGKDYDATLRITTAGESSSLVTLGAVVVEREMTLYRALTNPMFAFATPYYNTQYSGYYAGNWVRTPSVDANGSTRYILANKPDPLHPTYINRDQYVIDPLITLKSANTYLIQPRPTGFDYSTLSSENGLLITGASDPFYSAYDKGKFYFDGKVYKLTPYQEQLFAQDNLYSRTIGTTGVTLNWLIGNSYTSPMSVELIRKKLVASGLNFYDTFYVFPAGSTGYQPCSFSGTGDNILVYNTTEIPAMSIIMVRIPGTNTATGTFSIGKTELVQSNISHGMPVPYSAPAGASANRQTVRAESNQSVNVTNQLLFRVSPQSNPNIFDLAAIGLRATAVLGSDDYDVPKIYGDDYSYQMYTLSSSGSKLAADGVPADVNSVNLYFRPADTEDSYTLSADYVNTLSTEIVWLEDLQTSTTVDLRIQPAYTFTSSPTDAFGRFVVHFVRPVATDVNTTGNGDNINIYLTGDNLIFKNLSSVDVGSLATIYDVDGRVVRNQIVDSEEFQMKAELERGIYLVRLEGKRTVIKKVIKTKNH